MKNHTHKYVTGESGTIAVCNECSRFKHVGSGTPIVEIPVKQERSDVSASEHTPTPLGSNNTVDDIERMLDWKDTREAVVRAVNAYEKDKETIKELVEALKGTVRAIEYLSGTTQHELLYKAAKKAISKAEGSEVTK